MGGWGCRYQVGEHCRKMNMAVCDPGMAGCVLRGKYHFPLNESKDTKNIRQLEKSYDIKLDNKSGLNEVEESDFNSNK